MLHELVGASIILSSFNTVLCVESSIAEPVAASKLMPGEEKLVSIYESKRYGVVSIIDIKLRGMGGGGGSPDTPEGNGTGVVFDREGNVITNWHVLQTSLKDSNPQPGSVIARVTVLRPDNTKQTFNGLLVGADKARDLAVIRMEGINTSLISPLEFDSTAPKVGQQAVVIGNPFGFFQSFSIGVIGGLGRIIKSQTGSMIPNGIQHDATTNPGSSGGPLMNSDGKVIGINTAIFTPTGFSVGIGFAISSEVVLRVIPQLLKNGKVTRASLGLTVAEEGLAKKLGISAGVMIKTVADSGPAAKAGLQGLRRGLQGVISGDAILELQGRSINSESDLESQLDQLSAGESVELKVEAVNDQGSREVKTILITLEEDRS